MLDGLCAETSCVFCPVSWCLICRRDSVVLSCLIEKKKKKKKKVLRTGGMGWWGGGAGTVE